MKTFNQFCSEAYELDENVLANVAKSAWASPVVKRVIGKTRAGRFVRSFALPDIPGPVGDLVDIGVSGATTGPTGAVITGLSKASKYMAPVGKAISDVNMERDDIVRKALSKSPRTRNMSFGERERLVQGTRLKGV